MKEEDYIKNEKEFDIKIRDKEKIIEKLESKIKEIYKTSNYNSDIFNLIDNTKNKNKCIIENINSNKNNDNCVNPYNNDNNNNNANNNDINDNNNNFNNNINSNNNYDNNNFNNNNNNYDNNNFNNNNNYDNNNFNNNNDNYNNNYDNNNNNNNNNFNNNNYNNYNNNNYYNNNNNNIYNISNNNNYNNNFQNNYYINNNNNHIYNNNSINNYNNNFDNNHTESKIAPLVGLIDVGENKFMNSILQCLSQTFPLTKYFLNKNNKRNILMNQNNLQISPLYLELIDNLWNKKSGSNIYQPYSFKNMIENNNYNNHRIDKAKYLISFILEQLDNELSQQNNSNSIQDKVNRFDRKNAFKHFFNEFLKKISIISEIFVGFIESKNECLNCKRIYNSQYEVNPKYYTYEIFKYLIFPLDKIKDMKNNSNNNIVTIYDCFEYNQIDKKFNRRYCNNCKKEFDVNVSSKIYVGPNILIIILENENNNPYAKLDIQLKINLTNFIIKKDYPTMIYDLYGIFSYFGNDTPSPYIACCLNQIDNHWYKFNNENISQINDINKDFIEKIIKAII